MKRSNGGWARPEEDRLAPTGVYASVPQVYPGGGVYRELRDVDPRLPEVDPEVHRWPCLCVECIPLSKSRIPSRCGPACTAADDRRYEIKPCTHRRRSSPIPAAVRARYRAAIEAGELFVTEVRDA